MKEIGLEVEIQQFGFVGWRPVRGPILKTLEPKKMDLKPGLMLFSGNTPDGGVTGKLEYAGTMYLIENMFEWPKYAVVDVEGNHLAYVVAFFDGPTISITPTKMGRFWGRAPYVLVGKKEHTLLKKWMSEGKTVTVNLQIKGEFSPDLTSQNVIGILRGENVSDEEIVLCAHYDSAFGSPGADDNASGVEAMLKVAEALAKKGTKKTVKFIAFGAEEYLMLGSAYYVESLKEQGQLRKIKAVVNLDMTGAGKTLTFASEPKEFSKLVRKAVYKSDLTKDIRIRAVKLCEDSDHWAFHVNGIPAAVILFWPYRYYHQSTDTADKVKEDIVEKTVRVAKTLIEMLAYAY